MGQGASPDGYAEAGRPSTSRAAGPPTAAPASANRPPPSDLRPRGRPQHGLVRCLLLIQIYHINFEGICRKDAIFRVEFNQLDSFFTDNALGDIT